MMTHRAAKGLLFLLALATMSRILTAVDPKNPNPKTNSVGASLIENMASSLGNLFQHTINPPPKKKPGPIQDFGGKNFGSGSFS